MIDYREESLLSRICRNLTSTTSSAVYRKAIKTVLFGILFINLQAELTQWTDLLVKLRTLSHDNLYSGVIVTQLLRDRFTFDRPRAEWRTQFLNEKAPLTTLHITRHPMAVQGL